MTGITADIAQTASLSSQDNSEVSICLRNGKDIIKKIRKIKNTNNIKLNPSKIFQILNSLDLKNKIVGGYYPVNFEMDDLQILKELENKGFKISLPIR